jgi:hypothetical protein
MTQMQERAPRRAPGQRGGPEWRGPRERVTTRVPLTEAALLRTRARQMGRSVSEYVADLIVEAVR